MRYFVKCLGEVQINYIHQARSWVLVLRGGPSRVGGVNSTLVAQTLTLRQTLTLYPARGAGNNVKLLWDNNCYNKKMIARSATFFQTI